MKKIITLWIFALFIMLGAVHAYSIGYVVNNPNNLASYETALRDLLISEGHTVTIIDDSTSQVNGYTLIIVSNSIISDINFDNKNYKTLFLSGKVASKRGLSSSYGTSSGRDIVIDRIEFITEGYTLGTKQVYSTQTNINYLLSCFATSAKSLAYKSDNTRSVLLMVDKNSLLLDGSCTRRSMRTNERNVFFGLYRAESWNADGKKLFLRSLVWLVDGGLIDKDGDGYIAPESGGNDCNDKDATINPGSSDIMKNCKNDAPRIIQSTPSETNLKFLRNIEKEFSIEVADETSGSLIINWKINGTVVANGLTYKFNKNTGDYVLEASISDGEFSAKK